MSLMLTGCGPSGAGDAGGGGSVAEVTQVTISDNDYDQALYGTYFNLYRAGNTRTAIVMDWGAKGASYTFTFADGTSGTVSWIAIDGGAPQELIWGDSTGETANIWYVSDGFPIIAADIANRFAALLNFWFGSSVDCSVAGGSVTVRATGATGAASSIQANFVTIATGRNAAGAISGVSSIIVSLVGNSGAAADIADNIKNALNDAGHWEAVRTGSIITITDLATGSRTDASDNSTGFTIATLTQGA
jgi:hypothetical protein